MKIDLSGKTAVVTGSTAGIGFAVAKGLAESGAAVIVNGRTQAAVAKAIGTLTNTVRGAVVRGIAADLGTAEGCASLLSSEPTADILVNNVGIYGPQDFFDIPDSEWTRFFEVNVLSGVRLSRGYLPGMVRQNWARVVFISSESALNIPADMIHYGFTKTANLAISRGLAKRLAGTSVTVNAVLPGPTLSEGLQDMLKADAGRTGESLEKVSVAFVKANRPSSIIQRAATAEEVANMVVCLFHAGLGHHRRRVAGGRRRGRDPRLRRRGSQPVAEPFGLKCRPPRPEAQRRSRSSCLRAIR